eukprot:CAMPEP_0119013408 /NCGR_PEP_ID=MMETSP1176-20130426/8436_1 /TAXON_ID=265551 /ORGANISM="Synedropsis recta cf, Strain CCMP1620" /LENGTH=313 /DNA_ID=CAMNT_0006966499 /DNA_START=137 /DNA_END=1078 /DNA_ORIENTATION=-
MKKIIWKVAFLLPVAVGGEGECMTALARAQALETPPATAVYGGDTEGLDFWNEHEELLQQARLDWGRKHDMLYDFSNEFIDQFVDPHVKEAIQSKSISKLKDLFEPSEKPGVYKIQLFNQEFVSQLLEELVHQEESNIPMRRPNGMNRYGCILDQIGFENLVQDLSDQILRPMAHIVFPNRVAVEDIAADYAFVVQYHPDADVNLAEHADASAITINICLQPSAEQSPLYFKNVRELGEPVQEVGPMNVTLDTPGMAVIHLGQHLHGVSNVTSSRSNMVVWLMGHHGYVRVAPYEEDEVAVNQAEWMKKHGWN